MTADKAILLRQIALFSEISNEELFSIAQNCQWSNIDEGQQVLSESELTSDIFFIVKGAVSVKSFSHSGKEVTYTDIRNGELFGEFSAIDGAPRSANVLALENSTIARLRSVDFRNILLAHPEVSLALAELLVSKLRHLTHRVFEFSTLSVRQRVRAELLRYCEQRPTEGKFVTIEPAPTHFEIATRISTHREAVSREFSHLVSEGVLEASRQRIRILDLKRLREMVSAPDPDELRS